MKLVSCFIKNFGTLHAETLDFNQKLHVLHAENGWGKSTLAAFIKVMLYGFSGEERRLCGREREYFLPWNGASCSGSLTFTYNGKTYTVFRSFGRKKTEDTFLLHDTDTGLPSTVFGKNLGEEIFALDQYSFAKTILCEQTALQKDSLFTDNINALLGDFFYRSNGLNMYEPALKKLTQTIEPLKKRSGKKAALEAELKILTKNILQKPQLLDALSTARTKLQMLEDFEHKLSLDSKERLAKNFQLHDSSHQTLLRLQKELQLCAEEAEAAGFTPSNISILAYLGLSVLVSGIVLLYLNTPAGWLILAAGFILLATGLLQTMLRQKKKRAELRSHMNRLHNNIDELHAAIRLTEATAPEIQEELRQKSMELARNKAAAGQHLDEIFCKLDQCRLSEEKLPFLTEAHADISQKITDLQLTQEILLSAKDSLTSRYKEPLQQNFIKYLEILAPFRKHSYTINAEGRISVAADGIPREFGALSSGSKDLLNLCLRLALADTVFTREKPFLILDDPFVNLDDKTLPQAESILRKLAEKYQIIYLTCSNARTI